MAPPGSGKTFTLLEVAQSMISKDVAVFVLDIGASYKNICKIQDGEMIQFNHSCNISLNPFASLADSGAVLMKALQLMEQGIDDEESSREPLYRDSLSHHRTSDVAYGGFAVMFTKS